jgi:hypothetical protein
MARARSGRVAQCRRPSQGKGLNRRLRRWLCHEFRRLRPVIQASAAECHADRYRKHFTALSHAYLLLFHGLSRGPSLTQSYHAFGACRPLATLAGLAASDDPEDERLSVSFSQFAASHTSRPPDFLAGLVPLLAERVRSLKGHTDAPLPPDIHLLDGTFVRLSLKLAAWLPNREPSDIPGVRLQFQYTPARDLPACLLITDTHTNDCQALDQLVADPQGVLASWREQTLVFDLGYYSHRRFAGLFAADVHLVTRLQGQATVQVTRDHPVPQPLPQMPAERIVVRSDQQITLGSPHNRAGAVLPNLRLVTAEVAPLPAASRRGAKPIVYRLITDRWDLRAHEVVQIYLWRWQIELFFRWLKSHLHLLPPLGSSRPALDLTVWLSLIVHLLVVLAAHALGLARRSPALLRQLLFALAQLAADDPFDDDLPGYQLAFGESPLPLARSP